MIRAKKPIIVPTRVAIRDAVERPPLSAMFPEETEVEALVSPEVVEDGRTEDTSLLDDCVAGVVKIVRLFHH